MVWEFVSDNPRKFTHWPDPFKGMVKNIDVWACEGTWQAYIEIAGAEFGDWFWTNFVPSPVELLRKSVTGSYKCGFYLLDHLNSPLDIVWRDGSVSAGLAEITSPAVVGLFYLWAAETAYNALSRWSTVLYAFDMCGATRNEALSGNGSVGLGTGYTIGTCPFQTSIYDPNHWLNVADGSVNVPVRSWVSLRVVGYVQSRSCVMTGVSVFFPYGPDRLGSVSLGDFGIAEQKSFTLSFDGYLDPCEIGPAIEAISTGNPLGDPLFKVERFTTRETHDRPDKSHCWQLPGNI